METQTIIFATGNPNKVEEVKNILLDQYQVLSLKDIGCFEDIPETGETFAENAIQKAKYVFEKYGKPCFAEDSGLEVDALEKAPGVYSARYAGVAKDDEANLNLVLKKMEGIQQRSARFRTAIAYISQKGIEIFEGKVEGNIIEAPRGTSGFGYDPIFKPVGYEETFAELGKEVKNIISHRAQAMNLFLKWLKNK